MPLTIDQAVPRFQTNETRFDTFVNGGVTATWRTSGGSVQPSITKFLADRASYVDALAATTLSASTAAKNAAIAARDEAVEAAETASSIAESVITGRFTRTIFKATAGQTTKSVTYDVGFVDVYVNGFRLVSGDDFTATNGTSVTFTTALTLNDDVEIVAFGTFMLANALLKSSNLSDLASVDTSLTNLGFTTLGKTLRSLADAAAGRTALGLGSAAVADLIDEDSFASNSATKAPSQQSTKAYVDASPRLGVAQTWQDLTASRAVNTSYRNTTGAPIEVKISTTGTTGNNYLSVSVDGSTWLIVSGSGSVLCRQPVSQRSSKLTVSCRLRARA